MRERGELRAEADPGALATAMLASTQGGILLSQAHRSTAPLEIALDTMLDYVASFLTPRGRKARRAGTARVRPPNRA